MDGDPALSVPNGTTNSIHTRPHDLPVAVHVDKRPKVTPNVTNGTACTPGVVAATENGSVGLTKPTGPVPPRTDIVVAAAPAAGTTANVSLHSYEHLSDEIALHVACRMGDVQKLQELLRKGVDIESVNKHGWRPLYLKAVSPDALLSEYAYFVLTPTLRLQARRRSQRPATMPCCPSFRKGAARRDRRVRLATPARCLRTR